MSKTKRASLGMEKQIASRGLRLELPRKRVQTVADASRFIDSVGFCVLFPVKNVPLPSLYYAVSHRTNARWDKFAQLIWAWKDELPKKRRAFYSKFFTGRGTFLSLQSLAYLLAAQQSAIAPDRAEDLAESVGDFADGGVRFDGGEDGGEKIFGGAGAALEFG